MENWTWHRAATAGGATTATGAAAIQPPRARTDHAAALWRRSATEEAMVVFGGGTHAGATAELWSLDCSGGAPAKWSWRLLGNSDRHGDSNGDSGGGGAWPPARTSHAVAIAGCGEGASLVVVGGENSGLGAGPAAIVADAWVLHPLGAAHRTWTRVDGWHGVYPLRRCRHSLVLVDDLAIVYGGYDGAHTLDEHHSLFCAPVPLRHEQTQTPQQPTQPPKPEQRQSAEAGRQRRQERWEAERPLTEAELPRAERERAAKSTLPLALAKALHRHALRCAPPRDTYIDPDTGYSVFTSAYLKRRPCCGNGCRHCPWGHMNVPSHRRKARSAASSSSSSSSDDDEEEDAGGRAARAKELEW